jgi:hypothetical protein
VVAAGGLDRQLRDALIPGKTVHGATFFEYSQDPGEIPSKGKRFRVSLLDGTGKRHVAIASEENAIPSGASSTSYSMGLNPVPNGGNINLLSYKRKRYLERPTLK